jgi:hypothetical protein
MTVMRVLLAIAGSIAVTEDVSAAAYKTATASA